MKKRKYYILLSLVSIIFLFNGCGKATANKEVNTDANAVIGISSLGTSKEDPQAYWGKIVHGFAKTEGGYYYVTNSTPYYLRYFDEKLKTSYPVCGKADCDHNNKDCNAYIGSVKFYDPKATENVYYSQGTVYYYQGYVYLLSSEGDLVKVSPDGSERTKIAQVYKFDASTTTKLVFNNNEVYVYNSLGHIGMNKEYSETINMYSLDGKVQKTIYEYKGTNSAISDVKIYGQKMLFVVSGMDNNSKGQGVVQYNYQGLFSYDLKTGEIGKVVDKQITGYCVDEKNNTLYYFVSADGLYKYNILTKEESKLFEANGNIGTAELSFDGNYVYMYNGMWVSLSGKTIDNSQKYCWVFDRDGKEINKISCSSTLFLFFGDENYLFAQQLNSLVYIDKKDIISAKDWQVLP